MFMLPPDLIFVIHFIMEPMVEFYLSYKCLQNSCARFLVKLNRYAHVTPVLKQLHWLPLRERIVFKILGMTSDFEMPS